MVRERSVRKSVYAALERDLREAIADRRFLPGQFLPSEHELTARYGISRRSVRNALAEMERDGLIHKKPGKGTVVGDLAQADRIQAGKTIAINFERETHGSYGRGGWDYYREQVALGACDCADEVGLRMELVSLAKLADRAPHLDGILLISPPRAYLANLSRLADVGVPIAVAGRAAPDERIGYVMMNHREWTCRGVDYLIRLGHRRIALIGGPLSLPPLDQRHLGYCDALSAHGLAYDEDLVLDGPIVPDYVRIVRQFLDDVQATAVFINGGGLASAALIAICERHRIPDEMSVMCFDDIQEYLDHPGPRITCIRQPLHALGSGAARVLVRMIKGGQPLREIIPGELVIRNSCARPEEERKKLQDLLTVQDVD